MRKWERTSVRWLGLAASLMLLTVACARNDDDSSASTAGSDGDSGRISSTSSPPSTTAKRADTQTSAPVTTESSVDSTTPETRDDPVDPVEIEATSVASITELIAAGDSLIGHTVELQVKAFFLEECPPPDATAGGPCSLLLFVGDADRNGLLYGERDLAVPGLVDGVRVSCEVGPDTRTACADWAQGALYEIVGTVRQPEFGRGVELDISKRAPT